MVSVLQAKSKVANQKKGTKVKKNKKDSSNQKAEYGLERDHDVRWNHKKVALFKILKKKGEGTASELAEASGEITARDVRHYGYHAKASGLVAINQYELDDKTGKGGMNRYYFSLTAAGRKIDPERELKNQKEAKE